jgi:hypothetical protein
MPPIDVRELTPADLEAARKNWTERMTSEHASARVFGSLLGPMMRAGLPADEIRRVAEMAHQEIDHGVLCARVLVALGAEPIGELPPLEVVPEHEDASPLEAVLRNIISIGCCSETVAVALVGTERELVGPPAVRRVLDRILADEVKHARFGWRIVGRLAAGLSNAVRAGIDAYLEDVFSHQIRFHAGFFDMPCSTDRAVAVGAPHGEANWTVFVDTMTEVVVPGLERLGFSSWRAWKEVAGIRGCGTRQPR